MLMNKKKQRNRKSQISNYNAPSWSDLSCGTQNIKDLLFLFLSILRCSDAYLFQSPNNSVMLLFCACWDIVFFVVVNLYHYFHGRTQKYNQQVFQTLMTVRFTTLVLSVSQLVFPTTFTFKIAGPQPKQHGQDHCYQWYLLLLKWWRALE